MDLVKRTNVIKATALDYNAKHVVNLKKQKKSKPKVK